MEEIDLVCDIESGILIHQLPNELIGKAREVLPRGIKRTFIDKSGLRVYFSSESKCNEFIRKKFIVLDGISFNIYSTATCLTVFDIYSSSITKQAIKFHLEAQGMPVFELYPIVHTNDYRIILDVPEVSANFQLSPISLDSDCRTIFPIAFFCRVCRREGHKQYQCQHSKKKMRGVDDTGNKSGGTSSNSARSSGQENNVKPSVSGVRNTGGGTRGTQSFGNLSARENLPAANPSTSRMELAAEIYMKAREILRAGSKNGDFNTGGGTTGAQNFGNTSAQVNLPVAYPSTSSTATAAEISMRPNDILRTGSSNAACGTPRKNFVKPVMNTPRSIKQQSSSKQKYPCKEIVNIIKKVPGILQPKRLCEFLKAVYHKQMVMKYALEFIDDIPRLIEQIDRVISQFYQQKSGTDIAKKQIRILEELCRRLEESWLNNDY